MYGWCVEEEEEWEKGFKVGLGVVHHKMWTREWGKDKEQKRNKKTHTQNGVDEYMDDGNTSNLVLFKHINVKQ